MKLFSRFVETITVHNSDIGSNGRAYVQLKVAHHILGGVDYENWYQTKDGDWKDAWNRRPNKARRKKLNKEALTMGSRIAQPL